MSNVPTDEFIRECLEYHNKCRDVHGVPRLQNSKRINEFAQEWAQKLASENALRHRSPNQYGENLYSAFGSDPNWRIHPRDPVKSWYDEVRKYTFGKPTPKNIAEVGHFSQLVWRETETMGLGMASGEKGRVYIVCNYEPAGNVAGQFHKGVPPAKKGVKLDLT